MTKRFVVQNQESLWTLGTYSAETSLKAREMALVDDDDENVAIDDLVAHELGAATKDILPGQDDWKVDDRGFAVPLHETVGQR